MRWPFVSRATMDAKVDGLTVALETQRTFTAHLVHELAKEQKRSEHLSDVVLQMRISGGAVARMNPEPVKSPRPKRSDVDQAIDENKYASSNPRLRTHLSLWAEKEIEKGRPESEVLEQLRTWSDVASDSEDDGE